MCQWSLDLIFKAKLNLESGNQKIILIWLQGSHFESGNNENQQTSAHSHKQNVLEIEIAKTNSSYNLETMPPNPENKIMKYGCQAAILKVASLKIDRLLSIHTGNVLLKFGSDIQSQPKVRFWKQKKSTLKKCGILTKVFCTSGPNLVVLAWTGDDLLCGQAQNGVNFDFDVKFDLEGQGQWPPPKKTKTEGSWPRSFTFVIQIWWS